MNQQQEDWNRLRAGSLTAFEALYHTFYDPLRGYGAKLCGDEETARNLVQDLFVYLWQNRQRLTPVTSVRQYLFVAMRRRVLNQIKADRRAGQRCRQASREAMSFSTQDFALAQDPDAGRNALVARMMNQLPARQREIVYLRYYQGMSIQEVADTLSLRYQSVANALQRAFQTLRHHSDVARLADVLLLLIVPVLPAVWP